MASPIPLSEAFRYCPRCGTRAAQVGEVPFSCPACEFRFFFGPVAAVGGILEADDGQVLLITRGRDPGKDKFGLPGGFVDPGEDVERALRREVEEEVGMQVDQCEYLTTEPNEYNYRGIVVPVVDVYYVCRVGSFATVTTCDREVAAHHVCTPGKGELENMAFESNRRALELYLERRRSR